ncbi:MAG: hypothetical protein CMB99_13745 [Flavobacteriaceae bacterium]|nr:hypothetical protein [Flavobacteriaceae bacterium]
MKKFVSYLYIFGGIALIGIGIQYFLKDLETYRVIFGFETENKYYYLIFRVIFGALVIWAGISRIQRN